jgi:hypothetical protein
MNMSSSKKPRLAWVSILPHDRREKTVASVSAYTSELLLPHLRNNFDIELFHEGFDPYRDFTCYHYLRLAARHTQRPFDLIFYQTEDGPQGHMTRASIGLLPGIVYFHDLLFRDSGPEPFHHSPWNAALTRFNGKTMQWPRRKVYFERTSPIGYREGAFALGALFSSERNLLEFRRHIEGGLLASERKKESHTAVLPYPVTLPTDTRSVNTAATFTIAYNGGFEIQERAHKVLRAIKQLKIPTHLFWLIDEKERTPVHDLLKDFAFTDVTLISPRTPSEWQKIVRRADIAVHTPF